METKEEREQRIERDRLNHYEHLAHCGAFPDPDEYHSLSRLEYHACRILQGILAGMSPDFLEARKGVLVETAVSLAKELIAQTNNHWAD